MGVFQKLERKKLKLRLCLAGPSGSGKTYSAMLIAKGLGGKAAILDTERGSASLYADTYPELCGAALLAPYAPERYVKAIKVAEEEGFDTIIIDSLSHAWMGEGGVLEMADLAKAATKNQFTAWRNVTPHHNRLVETMLQSNCHIIATLRTKTEWDFEEYLDSFGRTKKKPVKIGTKPIQREGIEYEFTLVLDMSVEKHVATASKDRTGLFDGNPRIPDIETGQILAQWLNGEIETPTKE